MKNFACSLLLLALLLLTVTACQNNEVVPTATAVPTIAPIEEAEATAEPTEEPTEEPAVEPTEAPAAVPTAEPTAEPMEASMEEPADEAALDGESKQLPEEMASQLDEFLQTQVYTDEANPQASTPGLILLVDTPAGRYLQAAGVGSLEDGTPMQKDDRLEIGSNSKSFTIVLLMQLQEQGILSLDDKLSDWLPELAASIPNGDQMTLRQLAQHTSGIWDYGDPIIGDAANNPDKLEQGFTPKELVQYAIDNGTPDFAPGAEGAWNYSNTGYILLGMVIEKAAGDSLQNLYQERIFDPLGLESALLIPGVPDAGEIVDGYWWKDDGTMVNTTNWNVSQGWAAGGLAMTAEDLLTYVKALSTGELFEDPDSLAQMLLFDPNGMGGFMPYGLGLIDFGFVQAPGFWGHEGQTAGFQSLWLTNPEIETTIIGLSDSASYQAFVFLNVVPMLGLDASSETAVSTNPCAASDLPYPRPEPDYSGKLERDFTPFAAALQAYSPAQVTAREALISDKTIPELQALLDNGDLTSVDMVVYYLERIQRYDVDKLNSVMELNPEALEIARALDDERAAGNVRGTMHGISVLLKDNIATADHLHTAAGAAVMLDWDPDRDAFLVNQLREAGAIILGKANLSEWANYMDSCMPSGFSVNGGQTRNPYGPFEAFGSSSGSAVSAASDLTTVSVGTETQGSIIMPAGINSVVALKTSRGLVSRDYVIPLLPWQDVPGPMGRSVTDVAVLLGAMTGVDDKDAETAKAAELAGTDFTQYLNSDTLADVSVGLPVWNDEALTAYYEQVRVTDEESQAKLRDALVKSDEGQREIGALLKKAGVTIVEFPVTDGPSIVDVQAALEYGFKDALNNFLGALGDAAPAGSLEEIIAFNNEDLANRAPYGQDHLEASQNTTVTAEANETIRDENQKSAGSGLDQLFELHGIDVVVSNVGQLYAPAGYPALTVPAGYREDGTPHGVTFVGGFLSEPQLLAVGYAFEQAANARVAPDIEATMQLIEGIENSSQ